MISKRPQKTKMLTLFLKSKKVKSKNNLKGGDPNDNPSDGRDLIEQAFLSQQLDEFMETIDKKYSKFQNEISRTIENYIKESYSTQSKIGKNALTQSKNFEPAIKIMGDTFDGVVVEKEQKDKKIEFLVNRIVLPDFKVIEETNRLRP